MLTESCLYAVPDYSIPKPQIKIKNFDLFTGDLSKIKLTDKLSINTINQYSYCIACADKEFKKALAQSDILLPDGMAIVKAVKLLTGKSIKKIAGSDLHNYLLQELTKTSGSCFYLGSSESTLAKIKQKIALQHPCIEVNSYSPPYKNIFSHEDSLAMIEAVNRHHPDVLFIGLTAPKQEKWALSNKTLLNANLICCVGAVFDYYAGTIKRPPKIWIRLGLEWFVRLVKEPRRMWKRYLLYGPVFIYQMLKKNPRQQ